MAIKLDLANAFDRLRHSFIILVLKSFGFPSVFINQVQACITSPWIAPLINGRPSEFFKASRGVRQGCPLSPFLYILVADSLSRRLNRLQAEGSLPGLSYRDVVPPINHALFADDSIFLGIASSQIARNFLRPLDIFLQSSGSAANLSKCQNMDGIVLQQLSAASLKSFKLKSIPIGLTSLIWASLWLRNPWLPQCGIRSFKKSKTRSIPLDRNGWI